jgi:dipeptidase E
MKLLLLSNSTLPNEPYLGWTREHIKAFLGEDSAKILFIPYAAVTFSFDQYEEITARAFREMGYELNSIHKEENPVTAVANAEVIAVGGGNTFQLISMLQEKALLDPIREKVQAGTPYMGWSAGSNAACPTLKTTNDMPIAEPSSFEALNLIPFQINPHYTEATIPNHGGESRDQRILEFCEANPGMRVAGIPEGSLLRVEDEEIQFTGAEMKIFEKEEEPRTISDGAALSLALD